MDNVHVLTIVVDYVILNNAREKSPFVLLRSWCVFEAKGHVQYFYPLSPSRCQTYCGLSSVEKIFIVYNISNMSSDRFHE